MLSSKCDDDSTVVETKYDKTFCHIGFYFYASLFCFFHFFFVAGFCHVGWKFYKRYSEKNCLPHEDFIFILLDHFSLVYEVYSFHLHLTNKTSSCLVMFLVLICFILKITKVKKFHNSPRSYPRKHMLLRLISSQANIFWIDNYYFCFRLTFKSKLLPVIPAKHLHHLITCLLCYMAKAKRFLMMKCV